MGTTELKVEGNFVNLLKLVHLLEQKEAVGRVSSSSFDAVFDNKRKKKGFGTDYISSNTQNKKR